MLTFKEVESYNQIYLSIHKPTLRYLDEFIKLKCAPDLLNLRLFPNAKEITESMATFNAVRKNIIYDGLNYQDEDVLLLDIGCGNTPRTAALFAFRTKWECHAIDPRANLPKISNLITYPFNFHEYYSSDYPELNNYKAIIICAVHAHIHPSEILEFMSLSANNYQGNVYLIYIPCCEFVNEIIDFNKKWLLSKKHSLLITKLDDILKNDKRDDKRDDKTKIATLLLANYFDYGIWSPMREIYIYKFRNI